MRRRHECLDAETSKTLHRWRLRAMTSLSWANGIASLDANSTANARKKRQTTASLRPSWWKWRTRWNVLSLSSLSVKVINLPSHRRDTRFVVRDHRSTPKGLSVLWCEGSVNGLCCTVCSSHNRCTPLVVCCMSDIHVDNHIISSLSQVFLSTRPTYTCNHIFTSVRRSTNITTMLTNDLVVDKGCIFVWWSVIDDPYPLLGIRLGSMRECVPMVGRGFLGTARFTSPTISFCHRHHHPIFFHILISLFFIPLFPWCSCSLSILVHPQWDSSFLLSNGQRCEGHCWFPERGRFTLDLGGTSRLKFGTEFLEENRAVESSSPLLVL